MAESSAADEHEIKGMEFITETTDYNVAEFYEAFHHSLPKIVKVNQGFYGEILEDTFDRDQILRLVAISRQKRVVAHCSIGSHAKLLSIPVNYDEKLCIVKHGKPGKEKLLYNIMKDHTLPLTVQFPRDRHITVGNQSISTNHFPHLELKQTFDEVYLLGNFITDGVMGQEVTHVPLYLSRLRLSVVTGIKGQPKEKWNGYQEELERQSSYIEYDQEFGNPNIAEYDPSAIHSDTTYSYVEPTAYSNFISLVQKSPSKSFDNVAYNPEHLHNDHVTKTDAHAHDSEKHDHGPNVYEEIDNTARAATDGQEKQPVKLTAFKKELENTIKHDNKHSSPKLHAHSEHTKQHPPEIAPKPAHATQHTTGSATSGLIPPAVPERKAIPGHVTSLKKPDPVKSPYTNDVQRVEISPTMQQPKQSTGDQKVPERVVREVNSPDDVIKLSIDDVSAYLKTLKLEQYINSFKEQMIDGKMLVELDKSMLMEEFGMKAIESLRLLKFAKDGHVPT